MCNRPVRGMTLLELVAVILVIGVLVTLLLPSIGSGGGSLRTHCANRERQWSLALMNFDGTRGQFPGYWAPHRAPNSDEYPEHLTWVASVLPYIEQQQLYDLAFGPESDPAYFERSGGPMYLELLICPSNPPKSKSGGPNSYVVNCGRTDAPAPRSVEEAAAATSPPDWAGNGLFSLRLPRAMREANPLVDQAMSSDDIADGAANTMLLSENVQAGPWWMAPPMNDAGWPLATERALGFVWSPELDPGDATRPARRERQINFGRGHRLSPINQKYDMAYARPSSNHPGGVNVAFADGHVQFISEKIDYRVYCQLMTSDSSRLGEPGGAAGPPSGAPWAAEAVDVESIR